MAVPVSSLYASMPIPRTRLIARESERAAACALLLEDSVPLLTLTGPGGVGKTRLALAIAQEVATHFSDEVVWVDLAPLQEVTLVPEALVAALGLRPPSGVLLSTALARHLRSRQMLLLLDNCEHVLAEVAFLVATLLSTCLDLQILATSRAPLRVQGEHELPIAPLPLPEENREEGVRLQDYAAVQLFLERARAVDPSLPVHASSLTAIATICRRLDGLPLAIELAAARMRALSVAALATRLERRLPLLTEGARNAPARQRTIRDTIAWSYDLLHPDDQTLFRKLSVFSGGFTLEAARALTGDLEAVDSLLALERLVEHNLVRRLRGDGDPRFVMLETIREFALELLAATGEATMVSHLHTTYFVDFAERAGGALPGPEEGVWLDQVEAEIPNLRAALAWLEERGESVGALRLVGALQWFWHMRGHLGEARTWLDRALAIDPTSHSVERARALDAASLIAWQHGDDTQATALAQASLALGRVLDEPAAIAGALRTLGLVAVREGQYEHVRALLEEALARYRALEDRFWEALSLVNLSTAFRSDRPERRHLQEEAIAHFREQGTTWGAALALGELGRTMTFQGHALRARTFVVEALALTWLRRDRWLLIACFELLAEGLILRSLHQKAARLLGAAAALRDAFGLTVDVIHDVGDPVAQIPITDPAFVAAWEAGKALSLSEAVAEALNESAADASEVDPRAESSPIAGDLTRREREVLQLLAAGRSNHQIAHNLSLSERTVENHVRHILAKLDLPSRTAAAAFAIRQGLA